MYMTIRVLGQAPRRHPRSQARGACSPNMRAGSSASGTLFDVRSRPRREGGLNGSLTPLRPRRAPSQHLTESNTPGHVDNTLQYGAKSNALGLEKSPSLWPAADGGTAWNRGVVGVAGEGFGGAGISLHDTEERISQLERAEFDLKMRLYYAEERLEDAAGGADAAQLHREIAQSKRHRAQAEESLRATRNAAATLEAKCEELQAQVNSAEARRKAHEEEQAAAEAANVTRVKKHVRLLEDALRAERAENARLRLTSADRRYSTDSLGEYPVGEGHSRPFPSRRRSTGDAYTSEAGETSTRKCGLGGREEREHRRSLEAKVRSQESSLRSLGADVTSLRRRLQMQTEALARQTDEKEALTHAAEQVACVEAEEIARLAVELEQAVREAKLEKGKRQIAEKRLVVAHQRLLRRNVNNENQSNAHNNDDSNGVRPSHATNARRSQSPALRPSSSPSKLPTSNRHGVSANGERDPKHAKSDSGAVVEGRASVFGCVKSSLGTEVPGKMEEGNWKRGLKLVPAKSRVTASSELSRDKPLQASENYGGRLRQSSSPRSGRGGDRKSGRLRASPRGGESGEEGKCKRRPWGSPPPKPKIRLEESSESTPKSPDAAQRSSSEERAPPSKPRYEKGASFRRPTGEANDGDAQRHQLASGKDRVIRGNITQIPPHLTDRQGREVHNANVAGGRPACSDVTESVDRPAGDDDIAESDDPRQFFARSSGIRTNSAADVHNNAGTTRRGRREETAAARDMRSASDDDDKLRPGTWPRSHSGQDPDRISANLGLNGHANILPDDHEPHRMRIDSKVGSRDGVGVAGLSFAAAFDCVDLAATVARELHLAAATRGTGGGMMSAPSVGVPSGRDAEVGHEKNVASPKSHDHDGLLSSRSMKTVPLEHDRTRRRRGIRSRNGASKVIGNDDDSGSSNNSSHRMEKGSTLGDGGRSLKSREVADLESDVHDIFRFFAGRKGLDVGDGSGSGEGARGPGANDPSSAAIGHALAMWGSGDR